MPFNGSQYTLSCTVTVDDSVDTDITISSQWLVTGGRDVAAEDTVSNRTERVGDLEQRHDLTFSPLRSQDRGTYIYTTSVNPEGGIQFIFSTTDMISAIVTVEGN